MNYAGIIFYNDGVPMLERCMKSCRKAGLKTIAIDGKFSAFKDDNPYFHSNDGCMEYAKENADIFIPSPPKGWQDIWGGQPAKRTAYLRAAKENDFVLVIDADEIICNDELNFNKFSTNWKEELDRLIGTTEEIAPHLKNDLYSLQYTLTSAQKMYGAQVPRMHRVYDDLIYSYRHCYLYREGQMSKDNKVQGVKSLICKNILKSVSGKDFRLIHFSEKRSEDRCRQDINYMQSRKEENITQEIYNKHTGGFLIDAARIRAEELREKLKPEKPDEAKERYLKALQRINDSDAFSVKVDGRISHE